MIDKRGLLCQVVDITKGRIHSIRGGGLSRNIDMLRMLDTRLLKLRIVVGNSSTIKGTCLLRLQGAPCCITRKKLIRDQRQINVLNCERSKIELRPLVIELIN
jgi:hypothetical protein